MNWITLILLVHVILLGIIDLSSADARSNHPNGLEELEASRDFINIISQPAMNEEQTPYYNMRSKLQNDLDVNSTKTKRVRKVRRRKIPIIQNNNSESKMNDSGNEEILKTDLNKSPIYGVVVPALMVASNNNNNNGSSFITKPRRRKLKRRRRVTTTPGPLSSSDLQKINYLSKEEKRRQQMEKQREMLRLMEEQKLLKIAERERLKEERLRRREEKLRLREHRKVLREQKRIGRLSRRREKLAEQQQQQQNQFDTDIIAVTNYSNSFKVSPAFNQRLVSPKESKFSLATVDPQNDENNRMKTSVTGRNLSPIGDLSCMKDRFKPAPEVQNADIKYMRNDIFGVENSYLEAEYHCRPGYQMKPEYLNTTIYCKNKKWFGKIPECKKILVITKKPSGICLHRNECDQLCFMENGKPVCSCYKGFKMKNNRCVDVNECMENKSICEYGCTNTVGSYRCKCPKGLRIGDGNSCIDVNECLLRNGHGPCQDTCINIWGGYNCSCDNLAGTKLSQDGHSCEDVDECSINNGGCSHTCLNTLGRAFCICPEGWIIDDDWRTCVDINECESQELLKPELRCQYGCINIPGSYKCVNEIGADQPVIDEISILCPKGYSYNIKVGECQDIDECIINNGGCTEKCTNTIGSFHCTCQAGFVFTADKFTCVASNSSADIVCPPLYPSRHGYLECSRPEESDNGNGGSLGRRRVTNRPGSQCILRCPTGFLATGKFAKTCGNNGEWIGDGDGVCIRYPTPNLICPSDVKIEIPPNETIAKFQIPKPKTDFRWDREIKTEPSWAKATEVSLEIGSFNVTHAIEHPISHVTVTCSFTINVIEGNPPVVTFCPETQKYLLNKQYDTIKIVWIEPTFTDNINVTDISRTNIPGNYFGYGSHQIIYEAKDQAGYKTRCIFKILVNAPKRRGLNVQFPIHF